MRDNKNFDKWAGDYDESIISSQDEFPFIGYYDILNAVEKLVEPTEGLTILDVGLGTGLLAKRLCQLGCNIYGVDFSEKMLEKAKANIPTGQFVQTNIAIDHFSKFNNHKFDRIISSYFFHHLNDEQKLSLFQKTIENNLNCNGKIIIADVGFETMHDFKQAKINYKKYWDDDEYYLCGELILKQFKENNIPINYKQISTCAGLIIYPG